MTLLIAKVEAEEILVAADTQLTFEEKAGESPISGLKIFFVSPFIAIGYCGSVEEAHQIIRHIYQNHSADDFSSIANEIHKLRPKDNFTDFILMKAGANPQIVKIFDGGIAQASGSFAWIGNGEAASYLSREMNCCFRDISQKFDEMIGTRKFRDIGGLMTIAVGKADGFQFQPRVFLAAPPHLVQRTDEWEAISFGTAADGGFGYTTITPKSMGANGWGYFFFQGNFGRYFHVDLERYQFLRYEGPANSVGSFIKSVQNEVGIELQSCGELG